MGEALVGGLLKSKDYLPEQIQVRDPDPARKKVLSSQYGIKVMANNVEGLEKVDILILAVKPQEAEAVIEEIAACLSENTLVISIMAGISTGWLKSRLSRVDKIVRAMPNAAAQVGQSTTGLYFRPEVKRQERQRIVNIFETMGIAIVVTKEDHLNIITGLSGSGPAYVFLILEALTDAGVYLGLSRPDASRLSLHTLLGSAVMAKELEKPFALLKEIITSPGGTTMAGLRVLEEEALRAALLKAVEGATERSRELSI